MWLGICKGVKGSELGSSGRGRGGVASSTGVPGASVESVRVGVAHGDPYGVELSDIHGSSEHKRRFFNGVGNSTSTKWQMLTIKRNLGNFKSLGCFHTHLVVSNCR